MYIPSHHVHHQYLLQDTIISYLDCCNSILIVHPISTLVYLLSNLHMAPRVIFFKIIYLTRFLNDFPLYSEKNSIPYHGLWVLEISGIMSANSFPTSLPITLLWSWWPSAYTSNLARLSLCQAFRPAVFWTGYILLCKKVCRLSMAWLLISFRALLRHQLFRDDFPWPLQLKEHPSNCLLSYISLYLSNTTYLVFPITM